MSQLEASPQAHAPDPGRPPLRRQRNFALLWAGQTVSLTGSAVTAVALPLAAISLLRAAVFLVLFSPLRNARDV